MIVVTGGAGLIGVNLIAKLNAIGRTDIIVVDNLNHAGKEANLKKVQYATYFDKAIFLEKLTGLTNIEIIYHQGACSSTTETDLDYLEKNNVAYSKVLLHYAMDNDIPFIYASSASVYGNGEFGFDDAHNNYKPINGYAQSKLDFDKYVTDLYSENSITNKVIGLRYFNVYGYGEAHKQHMSSVIYKFYEAYKKNESIKLFEGSDKILRDFISVDDIVVAILFCGDLQIKSGIYNLGTGKAASFTTLANSFKSYYKDAEIEYVPFPDQLKGKYQYFTEAKMSKLTDQGFNHEFDDVKKGVINYLEKLEHEQRG